MRLCHGESQERLKDRASERDLVGAYSDGTERLFENSADRYPSACAHNPHEHSGGPRSKVCVNVCIDELPPPPPFQFAYLRLCEQMCLSVWLSAGQPREIKQQRREGRELASKRAKVLITYRSNLADDFLKMRRGQLSAWLKRRERRQSTVQKSLGLPALLH